MPDLASLIDYFSRDIYSYVGVAIALFLTGLGLPVPEDIILLAAGFVTASGYARMDLMIILSMVSILSCDFMMYGLGHKFGNRIYSIRPFSYFFTPKRIEKIQKFYARYGRFTIFFGRFAPGLRIWVYIFAGASKVTAGRFLLMDFLAALLSIPFLVWLGFHFDDEIEQVAFFIDNTKEWILLLIGVLAVFFIVRKLIKR